MPKLNQDQVIELFLSKYNQKTSNSFAVTQWPDKVKRSQAQTEREIDAIAEAEGAVALAIEHTIIETRFDQMTTDSHFQRVTDELEQELRNANLGFSLLIYIPHGGIKKGQNWKELGLAIKNHIFQMAGKLPFGRTELTIENVPFSVTAEKSPAPPGGYTVAGTGRYGLMLDFHEETKEILKEALINKAAVLTKYKSTNYRTLLLLETNDVATMAPEIFCSMLQRSG